MRPTLRLVSIDAARGLALVGLMAIHILPAWDEETGEASFAWRVFSGTPQHCSPCRPGWGWR